MLLEECSVFDVAASFVSSVRGVLCYFIRRQGEKNRDVLPTDQLGGQLLCGTLRWKIYPKLICIGEGGSVTHSVESTCLFGWD